MNLTSRYVGTLKDTMLWSRSGTCLWAKNVYLMDRLRTIVSYELAQIMWQSLHNMILVFRVHDYFPLFYGSSKDSAMTETQPRGRVSQKV